MGADVELRVLPGRYGVARLEPAADLPAWAQGEVVSLTRTPAELTVVCAEEAIPGRVRAARGWVMLAVAGPLDLELTGVLSSLAAPLADAAVPLFAFGTYDTDYLLVRAADLDTAVTALRRGGHTVQGVREAGT